MRCDAEVRGMSPRWRCEEQYDGSTTLLMVQVLFLPDGPLNATGSNDGTRWTVKSIARNDETGQYLLAAAFQTGVYTFTAQVQRRARVRGCSNAPAWPASARRAGLGLEVRVAG